MKKNLHFISPCLALSLLVAGSAAMSAKHLVLHEKFTNTGCGPCARYAPSSDSLLNVRLGEVVPITYHGNYPDRQDKFYVANRDWINARIDQYGITGYPSVVLNGTETRYPVNFVSPRIDELLQEEQTMDLKIASTFKDGVLDVTLTATPLKVQNNANLRAFVCAVEDVVKLPNPADNGQTEFHYEVRHFMQEPEGYDMGAFADLTPATFQSSWTVEGFDDTRQMSIVAWLQDVATGKVIECVYSPKSTDIPNAAKVLVVTDTPDAICTPFYHGTVTFRNIGYEKLTSCNICVEINGKVQKTPWQGELEYLDRVTVTTPDFTEFDLDPDAKTNICRFFISDINGTDARSDAYRTDFKNSVVGQNAIEVSVFTDNKPEETAWELYDAQGNLLEKSEPFTEKRKFYKHIFNLPSDGCYRLRFTDEGGDGIIGQYGNGYYKLSQKTTDGKTKMITQGEYDGEEHALFFRLENAVSSVEAIEGVEPLTYDAASRTLSANGADASLTIVDMSGKRVATVRGISPMIDCSTFAAGVYVVTATIDSETYTKTIML